VLVYGAARSWLWVALVPGSPLLPGGSSGPGDALLLAGCALGMTGACALAFWPRREGWAPLVAVVPLSLQLAWSFSQAANHLFLELLCVALLCVASDGAEQSELLALRGLRWLTAIVLFQTGLQNLYGHYFHGDFLALMVGVQDRFARAFRLFLPAGEVARLGSYDPLRTGAGPYRVASPLFVAASNLVYLAELGLPFLMVLRRTRVLGALAGIALMVAIQGAALELGFAFLFLNLLFLFLDEDWNRRLLPVFAAVLLYAVGAAAGWLPGDPVHWNLM
jgi:hypothetical protein